MKRRLLDLFKGFILGLDSTIPGFSMGTLALLLNIYERLIDDFSDALKHPLKLFKNDIWIFLGFIIGFIVNIYAITFFLGNYPMQTIMFFIPLVFISMPSIYKNSKNDKFKAKEIITLVVCLVALVLLSLLNAGESVGASFDPIFLIMMLIMGAIGSAAMVIPGVSGSMIIMAFGYYDVIISSLHSMLNSVKSFNFEGSLVYVIALLVVLLGVIIGITLISKLIKLLLKKWPTALYSGILGLLIGSPFAIIYLTCKEYAINWSSPWTYIMSVIMLIVGFAFGMLIILMDKKVNKQETEEAESLKEN